MIVSDVVTEQLASMILLTFYSPAEETRSDWFGLTCRHRETDPRQLLNISTGPKPEAADMYHRLGEFWLRFQPAQAYATNLTAAAHLTIS